jgi:hypothetical protein
MKGPLSNLEKYAIDGMLQEGLDIDTIKNTMGRGTTSRVVENYIGEKAKNATIQFEKDNADSSFREKNLFKDPQPVVPEVNVDYDHEAVLRKMAAAGIHGEDALRLISKALPKFNNRKAETSEVYGEALRHVGPRELMIRSSHGGDEGIAIMTESAAYRGERIHERVTAKGLPDYAFKVDPNRKTN